MNHNEWNELPSEDPVFSIFDEKGRIDGLEAGTFQQLHDCWVPSTIEKGEFEEDLKRKKGEEDGDFY